MVISLFFVPSGLAFGRVEVQSFVLLGCVFAIGIESITKYIRMIRFKLFFATILIIILFLSTTRLSYIPFGLGGARYSSLTGEDRDVGYIYDEEVEGARWFNQNCENLPVYIDVLGSNIFMFAEDNAEVNVSIETLEKNIPNGNYYIFLRYANVVNGKVYNQYQPFVFGEALATDIKTYQPLLREKAKVYTNGEAEISLSTY